MDTNVFVSALRSRQGASFHLLSLVGIHDFTLCLSVPLLLEYEDAAKRWVGSHIAHSDQDVDDILDYLCAVGEHHEIFYLWRPMLRDPHDDMVLELAVSAGCDSIVTFNQADFRGAEQFGIRVMLPKAFLQEIGALP